MLTAYIFYTESVQQLIYFRLHFHQMPFSKEDKILIKNLQQLTVYTATRFYRAMHFSAKRGFAIACPSVRLSVTLVDCDHIGWNSSKLISPLVSL